MGKEKKQKRGSEKILFLMLAFACMSFTAIAQNSKTITGKVLDSENEPLIGATIQVKGTNVAVVTDLEGEFNIKVSDPKDILVFSYLGYDSKEVRVGNQSSMIVKLGENIELLEEIVVVGYGTQKKVNLTGSVTSIGKEQLENRPVLNVGQALQGTVPNLNISIANGSPNTVPSFNLRGGTSITIPSGKTAYSVESGSPFILIDGVEAGAINLNMLNPNDIESISVIKDASASAIYGTRATYGVILVTTKKGGFEQKTKVNYSFDLQYNKPTHLPDVLDSYTQHLASVMKGVYTGGTISSNDEAILAAKKAYMEDPANNPIWMFNESNKITWLGNFNPFKLAVRDYTPTTKHNFSISGGSKNVSYYLSAGYTDQSGFIKINTDKMKRYNVMGNFNIKVNDKFQVATKVSFTRQIYDEPNVPASKGTVWSALLNEASSNVNMPIRTPSVTQYPNGYPDATVNFTEIYDVWTDNLLSYVADTESWKKTTKETVYYNIVPTYQLLPELKLTGEFSYRPRTESQKQVMGQHYYVSDNWSMAPLNATNTLKEYETRTELYTMRLYANFDKTFAKKHNLSAVVGFDQELYKYRKSTIEATGLISTDIPVPNVSDQDKHTVSESLSETASRGVYGRISYNFMDRYLFEVNGRYDGSSKFTKNDRFHFFPSFSLGWRISEEAFMEEARHWLDNLKLRFSYGVIGSQPGGAYEQYATMGTGNSGWLSGSSQLIQVTAPSQLVARNLKWQKAGTTEVGIDATLLSNRLDFSLGVFERRVTDILLTGSDFPAVLGATAPLQNDGELKAYGWELSLGWRDKLENGFRYGVIFNIADSQTKVLQYTLNSSNSYGSLYKGKKMGEMWGYTALKIMQDADFITVEDKLVYLGPNQAAISSAWYPGDMIYKDLNGDGKIDNGSGTLTDRGDARIIGNSTPRYNYSINLDAGYKGFDIILMFTGVGKRDVYISNGAFWGNLSGAGSRYMYNNSWTPERVNAKYPMYGGGSKNYQGTGGLFDGSYLKLKQAIIGYTLPRHITKKISAEKIRFTLSGYNLFEITDIPNVFDPEQISSAYPSMRSFAFGVQVGF